MHVGFIGLGVMGFPMAGHLQQNNHQVTVYNRNPAKAEAWVAQYGGDSTSTPRQVAENCELVFACVGNDDDLRQICCGEQGAFAGMTTNSVFVDHTTASASIAQELQTMALAQGFDFLDAPVSGGQAGAENGALTVMVGGSQQAFDRAQEVIASYAKCCRLLGPSGSGQLTKMVNQICIAGLVQGLAEGLHFAQKSGLDAAAVVDVIAQGAAQSWQMDNRYQTMINGQFEFGFAVDWMRKDLGMALDEARKNKAQLPVTALVDQFYGEVQRLGGGRWDTSSLLKRLQ